MADPMREIETIIVGGGPAGSSAARELVRAGRECLVLDRKPMPRLKLCAGWITPKVLTDLEIDQQSYPHGMVKLGRMKFFFGRRHQFHQRSIFNSSHRIRRLAAETQRS